MSRKRPLKAKTMRILASDGLSYRFVHLYNVAFDTTKGPDTLQVYAPNDDAILNVANALYAGKGIFIAATSAERA